MDLNDFRFIVPPITRANAAQTAKSAHQLQKTVLLVVAATLLGLFAGDTAWLAAEDFHYNGSVHGAGTLPHFERQLLELPQPDFPMLAWELQRINRALGFVIENGAIATDAAGDPLLRDFTSATTDIADWQRAADDSGTAWFGAWRAASIDYIEHAVLQFAAPQREALRATLLEQLDDYSQRVRREQHRLTSLAHNSFLAIRLSDSWSLRRKSESHSAAATVETLARQTQGLVDDLGRGLSIDIDRNPTATPAQLIVQMQNWEESFRSGFAEGLEQWNGAERTLLQERLRWESASQSVYIDGERAWDAALAEIADSRADWVNRMVQLLQAGRSGWTEAAARFEHDYQQLMHDLATASESQSAQLLGGLQLHLDSVDQAYQAKALAESNLRFLASERSRLLQSNLLDAESPAHIEQQFDFWQQLVLESAKRVEEAETALLQAGDDLAGHYPLLARDPAQREIARLQARLEMLDHRVAVAAAVVQYAQDSSAGRATEALTRQRYATAGAALDAAEQRYRDQLANVSDAVLRLEQAHHQLAEQALRLSAAQHASDQARRIYQSRWEVWHVGDGSLIERTVAGLQQSVDAWQHSERDRQLWHYLDLAETVQRAAAVEEAAEVVSAIVEADDGEQSQLEAALERLAAAEMAIAGSESDAAIEQLYQAAEVELQRLLLIVELLQMPQAPPTASHAQHLQQLIDAAASEPERRLIEEVYHDIYDLVPAWARSLRGEVAERLVASLELYELESDPATRFALLQQSEQIPAYVQWAIAQVVPDEYGWQQVRQMMQHTADLLQREGAQQTPSAIDEAQLQDAFLAHEAEVAAQRSRINALLLDLQQWQSDRDGYYREQLEPAELQADEARALLEREQLEQRRLLGVIDSLTAALSAANGSLGELNRDVVDARRELQMASELKLYAGAGYALEENDPLSVLQQRVTERDHAAASLETLRQVSAVNMQSAMHQSLDSELFGAMQQLYHLHEVQNYLEMLAGHGSELEREQGRHYQSAIAAVRESVDTLFSLNLEQALQPDLVLTAASALTDFTALPLEDYLALAEDYFSYQNEAQWRQRSNEVALWLAALAEFDSALLRDFGLAYYYEQQAERFDQTGTPRIVHAAASDQNFNGLVNHSKVRTSVDQVLAGEARAAFERLQSSDQRFLLYRYFTTIMISGSLSFDPAHILPFIEKDLARIAVQHVEHRARRAERRVKKDTGFIKKLFGSKPWKPIQRRRRQMAKFSAAGESERSAFMHSVQSIADALSRVEAGNQAYQSLALIADTGDSWAQVARFIESSATPAPRQLEDTLRTAIDGIDVAAADTVDSLVAMLLESVDRRLVTAAARVAERSHQLDAHRSVLLQQYAALSTVPNENPQHLQQAAHGLFAPGAYHRQAEARVGLELATGVAVFSDGGKRNRMALVAAAVYETYQAALSGWFEAEQQRLAVDYEELSRGYHDWEVTMAELYRVGQDEWQRAAGRLVDMRRRWRDEFRRDYHGTEHIWDQKYALLAQSRHQWVTQATRHAVEAGSSSTARQLGIESAALIGQLDSIVIPDLSLWTAPDLPGVLQAETRLPELMALAETAGESLHAVHYTLAGQRPTLHLTVASLRSAEAVADLVSEAVYANAARISAMQIGRQVDDAQQRIERAVQQANRSTRKRFSDILEAAGYRGGANEFRRRVVVDRSLFGGEKRETQRISGYRDFVAPGFDPGVDLRQSRLEGLSGAVVQAMVSEAVENLNLYAQLIFGDNGSIAAGATFDESFMARVEAEARRFAASAQYGSHSNMQGLLAYHIGYAPQMRSGDPGRVRRAGYGETGRIMLRYMRYEADMAHGMAMLESTAWDVPLWDSSGLPIEAPSVRGVATLGVSIAATLLGQPWVALALTAANQAAFATLDTTVAGADAGAAWAQAGRGFAAAAAVTGIGGVFSGFGEYGSGFFEQGLSGVSSGGTAMGSTWYGSAAVAGTQQFAATVARSAIESPSFDVEAAFSERAITGYASASLAAGVSRGLESSWTVNPREFSHLEIQTGYDTRALSSLAGAAAGEGLHYALLGDATLNVVNVADLAAIAGRSWTDASGAPLRHGLIELGVHGNRLTGVALGGAGMDVGVTQLTSAAASVEQLFLIKKVQFDIDSASAKWHDLVGTTDRALRRDEAFFSGVSPEAGTLAQELERVRRMQSSSNVHTLFLENRSDYPERYMDQQLALALAQQDIEASQFLLATHFDTSGSFELAYSLYQQGAVSAAELFATQKAYAGAEHYDSQTYNRRLQLFLDYFAPDLQRAAEATRSDALLGDMVMADYGGNASADPLFDGVVYVGQLLGENDLRGVGSALDAVAELPQVFAEAVGGGQAGQAVVRYVAHLRELQARGVFAQDNLYDVFTTGDAAARATAAATVADNELAFRAAFRTAGGSSPGAAFTHFVTDGSSYFEVEVGYRDGTIRELSRNQIEREQYEHVQRLVEGRGTLTASLAFHDGVQMLYESSGLENLYWQEYDRLDSMAQESQRYRGLDFFCNLNTNEYSIAYGAPNLQNYQGRERTANEIHTLLSEGLANANGRFVEVTQTLAATAGQNGLLVIASQPRPTGSGHLAPVVGYEGERSSETDKDDLVRSVMVHNVGQETGPMTVHDAFGIGSVPHYFLWVPSF
ncbi:MAG: hypothetical protein EA404_12245 [Spirochaetaceae bacterium]|nr:MAG: hypothetical protein EA404_12245 [Spirochaetaceae bacterium]